MVTENPREGVGQDMGGEGINPRNAVLERGEGVRVGALSKAGIMGRGKKRVILSA